MKKRKNRRMRKRQKVMRRKMRKVNNKEMMMMRKRGESRERRRIGGERDTMLEYFTAVCDFSSVSQISREHNHRIFSSPFFFRY